MCKVGAGRKSQDSPHFRGSFRAPGPLISPPPLSARLTGRLSSSCFRLHLGPEQRLRPWLMNGPGRLLWENRPRTRRRKLGETGKVRERSQRGVSVPKWGKSQVGKRRKVSGIRGEREENAVGHQHRPGGKGTREQSGRRGCKLPRVLGTSGEGKEISGEH